MPITVTITLDGMMKTISEQELFALAAQGIIGPDTIVIVNGKQFYAKVAKGIVFGQPQQTERPVSVSPPQGKGFRHWCLEVLRFRGRARRLEYISCALIQVPFGYLVGFLWGLASPELGAWWVGTSELGATGLFATISALLIGIPVFLLALSQCVRRLHDMECSAWMAVLALIPIANIVLGIFLLFGKGPGQPGENCYGPDPREGGGFWNAVAAVLFKKLC